MPPPKCKVPSCKERGPFLCRSCGKHVCAYHSGAKAKTGNAVTCGRCLTLNIPATPSLYVQGQRIAPGTALADFRGETLYFVKVVQIPSPGKSGKCLFARRLEDVNDPFRCIVLYPGVVHGEIHV